MSNLMDKYKVRAYLETCTEVPTKEILSEKFNIPLNFIDIVLSDFELITFYRLTKLVVSILIDNGELKNGNEHFLCKKRKLISQLYSDGSIIKDKYLEYIDCEIKKREQYNFEFHLSVEDIKQLDKEVRNIPINKRKLKRVLNYLNFIDNPNEIVLSNLVNRASIIESVVKEDLDFFNISYKFVENEVIEDNKIEEIDSDFKEELIEDKETIVLDNGYELKGKIEKKKYNAAISHLDFFKEQFFEAEKPLSFLQMGKLLNLNRKTVARYIKLLKDIYGFERNKDIIKNKKKSEKEKIILRSRLPYYIKNVYKNQLEYSLLSIAEDLGITVKDVELDISNILKFYNISIIVSDMRG